MRISSVKVGDCVHEKELFFVGDSCFFLVINVKVDE